MKLQNGWSTIFQMIVVGENHTVWKLYPTWNWGGQYFQRLYELDSQNNHDFFH